MELVRRKIHGDEGLSGLRVRRHPTTRLLNGFVESEKSKVQDEIALLGDRDEDVGGDQSLFRVLSARDLPPFPA